MARIAFVEWDGVSLRVAVATLGRRNVALEYCAEEASLASGADWVAETVRRLHAAGVERLSGLVVTLGRSLVTFRELWVPNAPDNELAGIVRFQASRELGVPPEKAHLDYVILTRGGEPSAQLLALVASVTDEVFTACRRLAENLECELTAVVPRPFLVAQSARSVAGQELRGAVAVLYSNGVFLEVPVLVEGRLTLVRTLRSGSSGEEDLREELTRTALLVQHHPAGAALEAALVPGPSGEGDSLVRAVQGAGLRPVLYDPFAELRVRKLDEVIDHDRRVAWAALAGALIAYPDRWPLNIARPKMPEPESRLPSRRVLALAAAGVCLALILGAWTLWTVRSLDREIEVRRSQQQRLDRFLQAAAPLLKKHQTIEAWLGNGSTRVTWLHVLGDLSRVFPSTERVYLDTVSLRRGDNGQLRVVIEGYARSLDDVAEFHTALNSGTRFRARPRGGVQRVPRRRDYQWRFESEVSVLVEKPKAAGAASAARAGGRETVARRRAASPG